MPRVTVTGRSNVSLTALIARRRTPSYSSTTGSPASNLQWTFQDGRRPRVIKKLETLNGRRQETSLLQSQRGAFNSTSVSDSHLTSPKQHAATVENSSLSVAVDGKNARKSPGEAIMKEFLLDSLPLNDYMSTIHYNGKRALCGCQWSSALLVNQFTCNSSELRMAAPFFIAPIIALFKSGTALKVIGISTRVAVTVVAPLRFQARRILRWWHGHDHVSKIRAERAAIEAAQPDYTHPRHGGHFRRTTLVLLGAPVILLAFALLASLERTPVWGRWRVIMLSTDEEAMLVDEFLRPGAPEGSHLDTTLPRDWLAILRAACGEDAGPPGTLMGMPVLDMRTDWRARWVQNVFQQLEDGVVKSNLTSQNTIDCMVINVDGKDYVVPPVKYPLTIRPASLHHHGRSNEEAVEGPLLTRYACLVVESPVRNAFSLGFGPGLGTESAGQEAPGCIVVFTGLLDEILKEGAVDYPQAPKQTTSNIFGIFQRVSAPQPVFNGPSKHQTDQLAVILSHELSHLLLSHNLEGWATNNMYELLGTLTTDLIRSILYPLTAFFGPVFNDWFGEQIRVNSALGLKLKSSCESRKSETEADLLGLRLLLGAGIDPHVACDVWGDQGVLGRADYIEAEVQYSAGKAPGLGPEDNSWLDKNGFTRTHPFSCDRFLRIKEELESWQRPENIDSKF